MPPTQLLDPALYTLAWIAPVDIEARAALALFDKIHEGHFGVARGHDHVYHAGEIAGYNTILATLTPGSYGIGSAAALVSQVKLLFPNLWLGLVVGVAAGLPRLSHPELSIRDIRLGDVLVAQPSSRRDALIAYDLGRVVDESGRLELLRDGHALARIEPLVLSAMSKLSQRPETTVDSLWRHYQQIENKVCDDDGNTFAYPGHDKDVLYNGGIRVDRPRLRQRTRVWYGSIGSGNKLMRDATTRDKLRDEFDLIGLEMEAAGVINTIPVGVIRGVCDYGDRCKDKQWQPYAAAIAAAYAKHLLQTMPPSPPAALAHAAPKADVTLWQECLVSLAFPEMESRFHTMDPAADGTCRWLLTHSEYTAWAGCCGGLLWIKGNPGSGKSTVLKYILEQLKSDHRHLYLSFFFHGRGSELQRGRLGLFRSLLHQLLHQVPEALSNLLETFQHMLQRYGAKLQWYATDLCRFIESCLSKVLQTQSVYIFVDALDECGKEDGERLLSDFQRLLDKATSANGNNALRICLTCRRQPDWRWNPEYEILVDEQNRDDISAYVRAQLSETCVRFSDLIMEGAEGSFLWACLAVKRVLGQAGSRTWQAIEDDIRSIPPELNAIYRSLMENAEPDSTKLAQWLLFSTRPLSLDELRWAMFIDTDCCHLSLAGCERDVGFISCNLMMKKIVGQLSRGLAETKQIPGCGHVVQFIHQSVKEYFVNEFLGGVSSMPGKSLAGAQVIIRTQDAHRRLSQICLRYLAMEEIQQLADSKMGAELTSFAFLHYATTTWVMHLRQSDIVDSFAWLPNANHMEHWVKLYRVVQKYSPDCPPRGTTLMHVLSRYGIVGAMRSALALGHGDIDASDELGRTPLSWAAASGQKAAIELLLSTKRVCLHATDKDGWTALWYAAAHMHEAVVKMLLVEYRASFSGTEKKGQTLATWAAANGHAALTRLLFATGQVDMNAKDERGWTPLLSAAGHGHEDIVEQLLNFGVDVAWEEAFNVFAKSKVRRWAINIATVLADVVELLLGLGEGALLTETSRRPLLQLQSLPQIGIVRMLLPKKLGVENLRLSTTTIDIFSRGWCFWTLLIWALERENTTILYLLLAKNRIDVNHKDGSGRTVLSWAAENGYETTVKLLLSMAPVKVEDTNGDGNTPLLCAAKNGHETIVKHLLATGKVNINVKNAEGETPLLTAARNGNKAIVQQLLASSVVDVDAADKNGITPLLWAAIYAHEAVVYQLLMRKANVDLDRKLRINRVYWRRPELQRFFRVDFDPFFSYDGSCQEAVIRLLLPDISGILHGQIMAILDDTDWYCKVLLFWAAEQGYATIVDFLVNSGKIIVATENDYRVQTILMQLGHSRENRRRTWLRACSRVELAQGKVTMRSGNKQQKLLNAAEHGEFAVVKQILEQGRVNVNVTDACSRTSLRLAAANGHEAIVWQLLGVQNIDIDAKDAFGLTPLLCAAVYKHKDIVCQLLLHGARMEWEDPTPWLFLKCRWKYLSPGLLLSSAVASTSMVSFLLSLTMKGDKIVVLYLSLGPCLIGVLVVVLLICFDPRLMSAKEQRTAIVRLLLPDGSSFMQSAAQIDTELPGWYSRALLFWAVEEQSEAIVTLLVNVRQVDVKGTDVFGRTALARCAMKGCESMVRLLLTKSQLDVNAQDKDGRTALSWAAANGHKAIVKLLIEHGGVVTIADKAGRDPATFAADKGRRDIVELLESKLDGSFC